MAGMVQDWGVSEGLQSEEHLLGKELVAATAADI